MSARTMTECTECRSIRTWLFNPFHYVAGGPALFVGLLAVLGAGLIGSASNSHFDGVLDFHTGLAAPLWVFVCEGVVGWLAMAVLLLLAAKVVLKSHGRSVDIVGTQALARIPTLVTALAALLPGYREFTAKIAAQAQQGGPLSAGQFVPMEIAQFAMVCVVGLAMLVWMVALMYRAFAVSANVKGGKAIITFTIAVLVAEVLSKFALLPLYSSVR